MNSLLFRRTLATPLRSPAFSRLARPSPLPRHSLSPILTRAVASSVSNRPASQTFEHAKINIKEEAQHAAGDLAKAIAGGNNDKHHFVDITKDIVATVPRDVMLFGLAGAIPYLGASTTTVYLANRATAAITSIDPGVALTVLDQALTFQVTYGAVMLSFLGALHWGMEFAGYGGQQGYKRLALGTAPVLVAWSTLTLDPTMALATQWVAFTSMWYADSKATAAGWAPAWFSQYRFYLSVLIGSCIIGSLAGISYYGPVAGHGFASHDLQLIREERERLSDLRKGTVKGALGAEETKDGFLKITKHEAKEEKKEGSTEAKAEEGEKAKAEEGKDKEVK